MIMICLPNMYLSIKYYVRLIWFTGNVCLRPTTYIWKIRQTCKEIYPLKNNISYEQSSIKHGILCSLIDEKENRKY